MGREASEPRREIPYERLSSAAWGEKVAKTFHYRAAFGTWEYFGFCPRCGHDTSTSIGGAPIMRALTMADERPAPVTVPTLTVECQCSHQHGSDKTGCGAYMNVFNVQFK